MDWRFPNFDSRLDEPDPGSQDPPHIRDWRARVVAAAKVCPQFRPQAHTQDWCAGCNGPKYAHAQDTQYQWNMLIQRAGAKRNDHPCTLAVDRVRGEGVMRRFLPNAMFISGAMIAYAVDDFERGAVGLGVVECVISFACFLWHERRSEARS